MQKKPTRAVAAIFSLLVIVVIPIVSFASCKKEEKRGEYKISVEYKDGVICGKSVYTFINTSDNAFKEVKFNLYANAYASTAKYSPVEEKNKTDVFKGGYGGIEIEYAKVDGKNAEFTVCGQDSNVLSVATEEIFPDESAEIELGFKTTLPKANLRLGETSETINLADFFPVACKIENEAFVECLYSPYGDPYYADCNDYSVDLTVPSKYIVASSGYPEKTLADGDKTTYYYSLAGGRDFAFVLSEHFKVSSKRTGDVTVTCYTLKDDEKTAELAAEIISYFSELYGDYPYKTMSVAVTPFISGGMEYSGLCYIADGLTNDEFYYALIHEIAHEWWHCGVGNDQINAAYIDEGLAEVSAYLYLCDNEQEVKAQDMLDGAKAAYKAFYDISKTLSGVADSRMNRPLSEYSSLAEYVAIAYDKSLIMFVEYINTIGKTRAEKLLRKLYRDNLYGDITLTEITKTLGLKEHFISYVDGKVLI